MPTNYLRVLHYAKERGKNNVACEFFGVKKSAFYKWKNEFDQLGEKGLMRWFDAASYFIGCIP
ncbi:MAG: helix-turn-helix domain-containing protein [Flavobacteriaceae bacterium]|nr:helix-turn-helix domain-containing protein [Flavobacteriaceae bacterium]